MTQATFAHAFPRELASDLKQITPVLSAFGGHNLGDFQVSVLSQTVRIPYRLYSAGTAPALIGLSPLQLQMAQCLLTRSSDGYERQGALQDVIAIDTAWSIPFVVALIGEYVIEILDDIYLALPRLRPETVAGFIRENPAFYKLTKDRVASYWNCYYRRHHPSEYVGFRLLRALDAMAYPDSKPGLLRRSKYRPAFWPDRS